MKRTATFFNIRKLTYLAMLTALVIVLQLAVAPFVGAMTGLSPALVLIPFVLGASICGIGSGAWLGAVFSVIVLLDPTTLPFLEYNPVLTVLMVLVKGIGAAAISGVVYKLLRDKNKYLALILAAVSAPVINTGVFVLGLLVLFGGLPGREVYLIFAATNFPLELIINIVLVPVIYRLLDVTKALPKQ